MVWYGRTLTERDKYDEAEFLFRELWEDRNFPANRQDDLATAEAYLFIKQKQYTKAIPPLTKAIELSDSKKERARLSFSAEKQPEVWNGIQRPPETNYSRLV